ncbi:porin [Variovorax sp. PDC80]|uniref:porin n=1 Tax=Variovorax sp. PDC80 TaxID=1882827 RepID=UPI00210C55C3|nr:porin [Variovorax sp. PDC80]
MIIAVGNSIVSAHAQSSVQTYGLIDLGVEHVSGEGRPAISGTRMQFGTLPSRLGFRGTEDLGGGTKANFTLEMGINADTGTIGNGGRGFGRTSTLGLSGDWGAITLGRQLTYLNLSMTETDTMGPGAYSSGSLDPYLPNSRADNSIAYRGKFGAFTIGALYSLGRDVINTNSPGGTNCPGELPSDSRACRTLSGMIKYDATSWGVALGADRIYGGPGAFGGLTNSKLSDTRATLNGYVKFGDVKLTAGLLRRDNEGSSTSPRSDMWWLGGGYTIGPWLLESQLFKLDYKNSANGARLAVLRASYFLSKRSVLYGTVGHIQNSGSLALPVSAFPGLPNVIGGSQTGVMVGVRHAF